MADDKFTCETCTFWQDQNIIGHCRRYPKYYNTSKTYWCGEYLSKLQKIEDRPKRKYTRKTNVETNE